LQSNFMLHEANFNENRKNKLKFGVVHRISKCVINDAATFYIGAKPVCQELFFLVWCFSCTAHLLTSLSYYSKRVVSKSCHPIQMFHLQNQFTEFVDGKMETTCLTRMFVSTYKSTRRCHRKKGKHRHLHRRENLLSRNRIWLNLACGGPN
jgi:hypothetical protein